MHKTNPISTRAGCSPYIAASALLLLLTLLAFLTSTGCSHTAVHPADLLKKPLDAEMTVTGNGISYRVSVHLSACREDGTRDGEIRFLSPDSLAGITASVQNGTRTVTLDRFTETVARASDDGLFLPFALLAPSDTLPRSVRTENGQSILKVHLSDGRTLLVDPESGQLLSVTMGDLTAEAAWIESRTPGKDG